MIQSTTPVILFVYDHVIAVLASAWGVITGGVVNSCTFKNRYCVVKVAALVLAGVNRGTYLSPGIAYSRFGELVSLSASSVVVTYPPLYLS